MALLPPWWERVPKIERLKLNIFIYVAKTVY